MGDKWSTFVKKCLESCLYANETDKMFKKFLHYEDDSIELITAKEIKGVMSELKSVELSKDEYTASEVSDEELISRLFNTIKYSP